MTQGMKSSEFLIALAGMVVGLALVALGVFKGPPNLIEYGLMLLGVSTGGFSLARGLAKFGTATPADPVPPPAPAPPAPPSGPTP